MTNSEWTTARKNALRDHHAAGLSAAETARKLGATVPAVRKMARALGFLFMHRRRRPVTAHAPRRRPAPRAPKKGGIVRIWTPERDAVLIAGAGLGLRAFQIGEKLGLTVKQVRDRANALGLELTVDVDFRKHRARRRDLVADGVRSLPACPAPVMFLDRPADRCAFIPGDAAPADGAPARCCGAPVDRPGSAWCAHHRAICYTPAR